MGHRQDMTPKQRLEWDTMQYVARLNAKKGSNYEYWNDVKHGKLLKNGWSLYIFPSGNAEKFSNNTSSEHKAKDAVDKLRAENNYARVVAGYSKNPQRIKMFSVIYKSKRTRI